MAELGTANIGGRAVSAWLLESTAEELDLAARRTRPEVYSLPSDAFTSYATDVSSLYWKDQFGIVHVRAQFTTSASLHNGDWITMPVGFRPISNTKMWWLELDANSPGLVSRVMIGEVKASEGTLYVNFDNSGGALPNGRTVVAVATYVSEP